MAGFDFISFIIGLLLGMLIAIIIVWVAYFTRSSVFAFCPIQTRPCGAGDLFNDPGDALANTPSLGVSDILFINSEGRMFYKRVPRNTDCVPESNQVVYIQYPQYCSFSSSEGVPMTGTWKETAFNSNIYKPVGFAGPTIVTDGNCQPAVGQSVSSGVTLLRWDANPLSA